MICRRSSACSPSVAPMNADSCSKYAALSCGPVSTTGSGCSALAGSSRMPEQIEDLLGGAGAARKDHDAVRDAHERLEALLDVRHDHELIDDRIRRLGGDDAGLGEADVAPGADALLGVPDGRALHRALHGARAAARAHIEAAQAHLVPDLLGVLVLGVADGMAAPADDQVRPHLEVQQARIAQDVEHGVGDVCGFVEIEAAALDDLVRDEHDVAQHGEQVLLDAADHLAVDEGRRGRVADLELDAPCVAHDLDARSRGSDRRSPWRCRCRRRC